MSEGSDTGKGEFTAFRTTPEGTRRPVGKKKYGSGHNLPIDELPPIDPDTGEDVILVKNKPSTKGETKTSKVVEVQPEEGNSDTKVPKMAGVTVEQIEESIRRAGGRKGFIEQTLPEKDKD